MIDCRNSFVGLVTVIVVHTWDGGIMMIFWLLFSPWSTPGGRDRVSAGMLVFQGICLISKLYSCKSACQCAVHLFRFCGDFQYISFAWSIMIVNGSFVHPRYGRQCWRLFITASNSRS